MTTPKRCWKKPRPAKRRSAVIPPLLWTWDRDPAELVALVHAGGVVAIPTESSYGLAADPRSPAGVEAIFATKGRAGDQALPVVVADLDQAVDLGVDRGAPGLDLVAALWPAALSIVVPLARPIAASAGEASLAIRVPAHARLRALLQHTGALTATSANRSGEPPILDPIAVARLLGDTASAVIDDGILPGGPPSTLVRWDGGGLRVLRAGRFPLDRLPGSRATGAAGDAQRGR